jgi:hypothetical protein
MGDRTEPYGTPACISVGMDISPSTETEFSINCAEQEVQFQIFFVEDIPLCLIK